MLNQKKGPKPCSFSKSNERVRLEHRHLGNGPETVPECDPVDFQTTAVAFDSVLVGCVATIGRHGARRLVARRNTRSSPIGGCPRVVYGKQQQRRRRRRPSFM